MNKAIHLNICLIIQLTHKNEIQRQNNFHFIENKFTKISLKQKKTDSNCKTKERERESTLNNICESWSEKQYIPVFVITDSDWGQWLGTE